MTLAQISGEVEVKLNRVRTILARELTGVHQACLTCSFQAEDVLLAKLSQEYDPAIPVLFLDTGYHFAETYTYRDRIAREWRLNLINLLPEKTVAEQETERGLLYQSAPDQCCKLRKVEPDVYKRQGLTTAGRSAQTLASICQGQSGQGQDDGCLLYTSRCV